MNLGRWAVNQGVLVGLVAYSGVLEMWCLVQSGAGWGNGPLLMMSSCCTGWFEVCNRGQWDRLGGAGWSWRASGPWFGVLGQVGSFC